MQIIVTTKALDRLFGEKTLNINGRVMTKKEMEARAKAFVWVDSHMWLTNEAAKLTLLEDLEIPEIIKMIEGCVAGNTRYPADLIGELKRVG